MHQVIVTFGSIAFFIFHTAFIQKIYDNVTLGLGYTAPTAEIKAIQQTALKSITILYSLQLITMCATLVILNYK